jgi:2-polyprenyl-3-methyl-5-hydroxy-6-metoxy-1,4-benzoquinol methylase
MTDSLKYNTDLLLSGTSSFLEKRNALYDLHSIFVQAGALDAVNSDEKQAEWLDSGCAISPVSAGMCLFEIERTRLFVLGLIDAIRQQLNNTTHRPINVLDAGCGPYALLSLLSAQYFDAAEVNFHLLDIHEANLESASLLIKEMGLEKSFANFFMQDACCFEWEKDKPLHIVICETMLNALRKEPQVGVTLNLAKQLTKGGIFIPEKIEVDLVLLDAQLEKQERARSTENMDTNDLNYSVFETKLGTVMSLCAKSTQASISQNPLAEIEIPAGHDPFKHGLQLNTVINVFNGYNMQHSDSSLTAAVIFHQSIEPVLKAGDVISFHYNMQNEPAIRCESGGRFFETRGNCFKQVQVVQA